MFILTEPNGQGRTRPRAAYETDTTDDALAWQPEPDLPVERLASPPQRRSRAYTATKTVELGYSDSSTGWGGKGAGPVWGGSHLPRTGVEYFGEAARPAARRPSLKLHGRKPKTRQPPPALAYGASQRDQKKRF